MPDDNPNPPPQGAETKASRDAEQPTEPGAPQVGAPQAGAPQAGAPQAGAPQAGAEESAKEAAESFKKGLGLLWSAARTTADEIGREVKKGGVGDALQQAGRDLETAAGQAAKAVEDFLGRVSPAPPAATDQWPPPPQTDGKKPPPGGTAPPRTPEPTTEDGGVDPETGEPRDMRIQVDEN